MRTLTPFGNLIRPYLILLTPFYMFSKTLDVCLLLIFTSYQNVLGTIFPLLDIFSASPNAPTNTYIPVFSPVFGTFSSPIRGFQRLWTEVTNAYHSSFKRPPQKGVNSLALAAVLGAPALSVPISEVPYHSRVSGQEERMPFVVALMSLPGTDLLLMDTIYDVLKKSGMKTTVAAGKTM